MLDQILEAFDIRPHYDLDIMTSGQDLYDITTHVLAGMRTVLREFEPDTVLIQGDTTTTFGTALAAYYERIDVGHIEAGLRTGNIYSPYPEEVNRQLTTRLAKYHFAPTPLNRDNLLKENVDPESITVTGNTVIDALMMVVARLESDSQRRERVTENIRRAGLGREVLESANKMVLITGHRRESFGTGFVNICEAIRDLAIKHENVAMVYPVHLNPNVREPVEKILSDIDNVHLIEPVSYEEFIHLMNRCYLLLTDSGGIQEEAPAPGQAGSGDAREYRAPGGRGGRHRQAGGHGSRRDRGPYRGVAHGRGRLPANGHGRQSLWRWHGGGADCRLPRAAPIIGLSRPGSGPWVKHSLQRSAVVNYAGSAGRIRGISGRGDFQVKKLLKYERAQRR